MTRTLLDKELHDLDAQMMRLGSLVDTALAQALEALETGDQEKAGIVVVSDAPIDDLHLAIQEHTFLVLSLQQPLAGRDLRYLMALVPMAIDLERIGDEAESIAQHVLRMLPLRPVGIPQTGTPVQQEQEENSLTEAEGTEDQLTEASILRGILALGKEVRSLLQRTMKAFADRDAEAARTLWEQDRVVNKDGYAVRRDVMAILEGTHPIPPLQSDPHLMQRATYLLWIAYQLERAAAHCSNLCERIVFIVQGETDMLTQLEG
jgi:phosphate transport system protein